MVGGDLVRRRCKWPRRGGHARANMPGVEVELSRVRPPGRWMLTPRWYDDSRHVYLFVAWSAGFSWSCTSSYGVANQMMGIIAFKLWHVSINSDTSLRHGTSTVMAVARGARILPNMVYLIQVQ